MRELTFQVESGEETGGYVARWNDPQGVGISQGDAFEALHRMSADAVQGYFDVNDQEFDFQLDISQCLFT